MNQYEIMKMKTRDAIKDACFHLLGERGYSKLTVKEICKVANINRTTFYRHYTDVDEVLRQIENDLLELIHNSSSDLRSMVMSNAEWKPIVHNSFVQLLNVFNDNKDFLIPIMSVDGDPYFVRKYKQIIIDGLEQTFKKNNIHLGKYGKYLLIINSSSAVDAVYYWMKNQDLSVEDFAFFFEEILYTTTILEIKLRNKY